MSFSRIFATATLLFAALASARVEAQGSDVDLTVRLCNACHANRFAAASRNPHRVLDTPEWQARTGHAIGCFDCHGDVSDHVAAGGGRGTVFAFREEPALEQTERCLGCHRDTHPTFERSPHALAGLACSSCHRQHGAEVVTSLLREAEVPLEVAALGPATRICYDCHAERFAEFDFNERHRLREGVLECSSCHDPHATASRSLLGGFKQQQCLDCHVDKGGPFVFEHPASRVEGCTACHSPHGAPNRHLLTHQRVGELCFTCHAVVPQFHAGFNPAAPPRFGLDAQCTNCHTAVHGSNFDPFLLR
jgi:DmsE family decaheme c-type cytochrome